MHLRHLFLLAALSLAAALPAKEDPKAVLDAAVSKLENSGGVRGQLGIDKNIKLHRHVDIRNSPTEIHTERIAITVNGIVQEYFLLLNLIGFWQWR